MPLTLSQVRSGTPGTYVNPNEGFTANILEVVQKTAKASGKNFWVCKLADPADGSFTVEMSLFRPPAFTQGASIHCSGQGIKFENGNYGPKVTVSDKTVITIFNGAPQAQTTIPSPQAAPPPPQTTQLPPPSSQGARIAPDPQAVGMSLKLAGDILMHNARAASEPVDLPSLAGNLWEVAGAILEAGEGLRSGTKPESGLPF